MVGTIVGIILMVAIVIGMYITSARLMAENERLREQRDSGCIDLGSKITRLGQSQRREEIVRELQNVRSLADTELIDHAIEIIRCEGDTDDDTTEPT